MIWPLIRGAIYTGLGALQAAVDVYDAGKGVYRRLVGPARPKEPVNPLPHRDAERIAEFGRCAGHEDTPRCSTIRPPPR